MELNQEGFQKLNEEKECWNCGKEFKGNSNIGNPRCSQCKKDYKDQYGFSYKEYSKEELERFK